MDLGIITNLGVSGLAIWIMYQMHLNASKRFKEKDVELIQEIDKRDKIFHDYVNKAHSQYAVQVTENNNVMKEVAKVMKEVVSFLDKKNGSR